MIPCPVPSRVPCPVSRVHCPVTRFPCPMSRVLCRVTSRVSSHVPCPVSLSRTGGRLVGLRSRGPPMAHGEAVCTRMAPWTGPRLYIYTCIYIYMDICSAFSANKLRPGVALHPAPRYVEKHISLRELRPGVALPLAARYFESQTALYVASVE